MTVSVFGLGYVGLVNAGGLLRMGHKVIGVDIQEKKLEALKNGRMPIYEPEMDKYLSTKHIEDGLLQLTTDSNYAIEHSDVSVVCVGTPSRFNGAVDISQLTSTVSAIISATETAINQKSFHQIIIRSTVPPGTIVNHILPLFGQAGIGRDKAEVCYLPEFLREGKAFDDYFNPSLNVIGYEGKYSKHILSELYPNFDNNLFEVEFEIAEMIKYVNNVYHALKITFANEIAVTASSYGVDADRLMEVFCSEDKLNISPYYFRPGFAYGGSCLPKEVRAMNMLARSKGHKMPLLESIAPSNDQHIGRLVRMIHESGAGKAGFFGVTFKPDTDDTRESGIISAIDMLTRKIPDYKKRISIAICDKDMVLDKLKRNLDGQCSFSANQNGLLECDAVVLGPLKLNSDVMENLHNFEGSIIDLKWHKVPNSIKSKSNYTAIS